ncbi:MAG: alpha/beta fold hydrolase, partial [Gemmatimonadales bacterium]|nr:alpha/beta fold hydrolase [Gemmatimonadales bacterium]
MKPLLKFLLIGSGSVAVLVVATVIGIAVWLSVPGGIAASEHHPFRSPAAKQRYLKLYATMEGRWPVVSETTLLGTSYGQTFVRISGPDGAPPLVLLHGAGGSSLHWTPNIEALSEQYRTYAVDIIGDFGRSVYTRPIESAADYVTWLDELFDALGLGDDINLMGLSYGAWLTSQYALRFPDRLDKTVWLAPGGTVLPLSSEIRRASLSVLPHRYFTKRVMYWLMEDLAQRDDASRMILDEWVDAAFLGIASYRPRRMVPPPVLTDDELQSI